ncbi:hypothetical protein HOY82DRAFT_578380 [Tuber indicum]|nr:hypothetical protein HOY82DRAFT_578380 [Tuber indicum]
MECSSKFPRDPQKPQLTSCKHFCKHHHQHHHPYRLPPVPTTTIRNNGILLLSNSYGSYDNTPPLGNRSPQRDNLEIRRSVAKIHRGGSKSFDHQSWRTNGRAKRNSNSHPPSRLRRYLFCYIWRQQNRAHLRARLYLLHPQQRDR